MRVSILGMLVGLPMHDSMKVLMQMSSRMFCMFVVFIGFTFTERKPELV